MCTFEILTAVVVPRCEQGNGMMGCTARFHLCFHASYVALLIRHCPVPAARCPLPAARCVDPLPLLLMKTDAGGALLFVCGANTRWQSIELLYEFVVSLIFTAL